MRQKNVHKKERKTYCKTRTEKTHRKNKEREEKTH